MKKSNSKCVDAICIFALSLFDVKIHQLPSNQSINQKNLLSYLIYLTIDYFSLILSWLQQSKYILLKTLQSKANSPAKEQVKKLVWKIYADTQIDNQSKMIGIV